MALYLYRVYHFFLTSVYCTILFNKDWLVMSTFVLSTSPVTEGVIRPALWYIQIGVAIALLFFHLSYCSHFGNMFLYSFGIEVHLQL